MSHTINKFSLFDFCKKHAGKMEIYGEETLDEEGNIIPFIEQAALITHYLQLDRKGVVLPYRDKAESILNLWYEFFVGKRKAKKVTMGWLQNHLMLFSNIYSPICFRLHSRVQRILSSNSLISLLELVDSEWLFRILGGECVFSSEWDELARKTYYANYGDVPFGDITKESVKSKIPHGFDILCA